MINMQQLQASYQAGEKLKYVFFWGHTEKDPQRVSKACLSQWYPSPFSLNGLYYKTAEHYMMAAKARLFNDQQILARILQAESPVQAKSLGREVANFEAQIWDKECLSIVIAGNLAKFSQHPELADFLLKTDDRILVEASPVDKIWGIGLAEDAANIMNPLTWRGQNLLGFALMAVREQLTTHTLIR